MRNARFSLATLFGMLTAVSGVAAFFTYFSLQFRSNIANLGILRLRLLHDVSTPIDIDLFAWSVIAAIVYFTMPRRMSLRPGATPCAAVE